MISAEIIADSKSSHGNRCTTFVLTMPRIILAEFNTHRMLSKNSASSRAIPFSKMVKMVQSNPFIPIKWMKDHKGMQGAEYFQSEIEIGYCVDGWLKARDTAVEMSMKLGDYGLTKQIVNRLLEPFMWHKVIVTGTEWQNFFALRANGDAEIHMQELAYSMLIAYNSSTPKLLNSGEWHIPFGDQMDEDKLMGCHKYGTPEEGGTRNLDHFTSGRDTLAIKVATARCARISYNNFDGSVDYESDIKLHDRLAESGHMSPFEHCARVMHDEQYYWNFPSHGNTDGDGSNIYNMWSGNFKGFTQYRKLFTTENQTDTRVLIK